MKGTKLYKILLLALPILGTSITYANDVRFTPASEPVFSTPRAKPNIHMVLDDSSSMKTVDVPPYNGAPKDELIRRSVALEQTVTSLLNKYREKAYLGITLLYQFNSDAGLIALPLEDYSTVTDQEFDKHVKNISWLILNAPGNTPLYMAVYDTLKMFRGQPVSSRGARTQTQNVTMANGRTTKIYDYKQLSSPIRYRCQQSHMIVMTDGQPNSEDPRGIANVDKEKLKDGISYLSDRQHKDGIDIINGVDQKASISSLNLYGKALGEIIAETDLKKWVTESKDNANKDWDDIDGINGVTSYIPMPLNVHSVSLFVDPKHQIYQNLTHALSSIKENPGMNLGFAKGQGSAEDLLLAFDTIFSSIILSTSSTLSMNDRIHSDLLTKPPVMKPDGSVDLKSLGTIRYDTIYDFRQHFGSVRAMVPYISGKDGDEPIITSYELWSTDSSITPDQGRYVTYLKQDNKAVGLHLAELKDPNVLERFKSVYNAAKQNASQKINTLRNVEERQRAQEDVGRNFDENSIDWLTNFKKTSNLGDLRGRLNPLGSITNSDIVTANKDVLNISLAKDKVSPTLRRELSNWLLYKAKHQPKNFLIVGDNDGFINFINAQRGLTGSHKGGHRDTAYFPQILVHRFNDIALANRNASLVMEGKTGLVDAKVHQKNDDGIAGKNIYATIGLTSMGGGGKGLVGYRIYAETESAIQNWLNHKNTSSQPNPDDIYEKVTPLFEITNEGPFKTDGFDDLGYTYSGFEFFNRVDNSGQGQAIAIFGNGFGTEKSVLYFIDAYTGEKLHEIVLDPKGLGAGTPSIIVSKDTTNGVENGQMISKIYVGDYSGTLYKVEFDSNDFTSKDAKVTALFKVPESNYGQSAISVKPLVVKGKNSSLYRVFFGSGIAASLDLDRYDNSLVTHAIYSISDMPNKSKPGSVKLVKDETLSLIPLFTTENLKKGSVRYSAGNMPDYEQKKDYDLTLHTPVANPNEGVLNGNQNGWYIILSADNVGITDSAGLDSEAGSKGSGERIILNPQYDAIHDAVVFSTWGIKERGSRGDADSSEDPCITDLAFGKILAFYASTGGGSYETGIANKGSTGKAHGGLTGDGIEAAPEGNEKTKLEDLDLEDQKELLEIVDEDNSTYETSEENSGVYCVGSINGQTECVEIDRKPQPTGSDPIRLSIQSLFNS